MSKHVTIRDVARRAGVSISTVSFVLNKQSTEAISEKVRQRVAKAARDLDYHPNASAAGLARKRTRNLAIVFYKDPSIIANPFYSFVVQGVVKATTQQEYNLLFSFVDQTYTGPTELPKIIKEKNAEGVVFPYFVSPAMVRDIQRMGIAVVVVDEFPRVEDVDSIQIDNRLGAGLAAQHLLDLGHRNLGFLLPREERPSIVERAAGFRATLERNGIAFEPETHSFDIDELSFEAGYARAKELLAAGRRPTALVCPNDEVAAGVLRAAHELELKTPGDLSVTGFDDLVMSKFSDPPLTTVSLDKEEVGRRAVARLLLRLQGLDVPALTDVVPVKLLLRSSTAAPRGASRRSRSIPRVERLPRHHR